MIESAKVAALLREVAAAEIMPRFKTLSAGQIREKKPGQLVTEADVEAERVLTRLLRQLLPGSAVVGEEAVADDPGLLRVLEGEGAVWIIDPVDGTANFAKGNPRFAVILALVVDGVTRQGWIFDPVGGRMIVAERGGGAWMDRQRLAVLPDGPLESFCGSVKRGGRLATMVAKVGRKGSAAHDYIDLVTQILHFAHYKQLMPWDHAAGVLIHAEAGGYSRLLDGRAYRPVADTGALLLAPSEGAWRSLASVIA